MYCLEKFQRELAYFLDIDLRDLPKVQEILKAQGYTAVKKNDEIIELGGGKVNPKQKTIEKIDSYAKSDEFKALNKDKQEAILSLKNIEPSPMPQEITQENLENLFKHFNSKQDKTQREFYAKLFNDTKENPHIVLEVKRENELRQEYIKAYQHKDTHDLYYIAITKENDTIKVTGYPITKIKDVINQIKNAEKVVWRHQGDLTHTALDSKKSLSLENANNIIPQPNKQTFESFKQSLESQGIPIENEVKSFINFVEKNIYNENGVSFNQLNNALKTLNSYYKEAKDPNFKNHIKNAMDSFLRDDIKAGIEAIFSQNKSAYKDISSLYATALSDYADMKEVLKIADKLKIRNATTEQNKALDSLLKLAKGQGDKLDNISTLTKALDKDNRALIELNMLSGLFQKSLYDENALQVIDSGKFFKELQALHKDTFQSKEAQDFINIMSDFDRLFKNDILIAKALKPTTTGQIGSSIATSIEGAVKFQMVKNAFSHLVRLMPHIPFMSGLNQKVQGAALRYHLQKALESSFSVSELKHTLQKAIAKAPYTSQTKEQIEKILTRVDTIQDELIEVAKEANHFYTQREETKLILNAKSGKDIVNQNDGRIAQISRKNIAKMTSDKAIAKSVANGFSPQEHFNAVQEVDKLYQGAVLKETHKDKKSENPNVFIHRYNADFNGNNALITIKESLDSNSKGNKIYTLELEALELKPSAPEPQGSATMSRNTGYAEPVTPTETPNNIIPQDSTKAQSEYFNPFMNEYEKIKEIKKLHTQDDNLIRVMKVEDRNDYIEPLSNMGVSKEYLQKQTAQSLKEQITQAILGNQTQLKALQQGYNTYHLSPFQKEVLESALDIANNPTKLKAYKLQGLQKQLDNLNNNEVYHIEKGREYDKARYAKDREELEKEITALKGTESSLESAPQKVESSDIIFTDTKGKEHTLTKQVQEQWCETFNLKSLDESYTPKHSDEILQALGGKEIKLQLGSLKKLVAQGREQYIPQIKEVLDSPEAILKDSDNAFLFAKHLKDDDYFVNVSVDKGEYLVSISNGIKETNNIKNKLDSGAEVIYQSPNANSNLQTLLQTSRYSANKIDSDIIPQMPKDNPQLVALQTKIQEVKEFIAKSKNPDKEYLHHAFKPDEIIQLERQYFNQAIPQEYKELIQDFPRLYEQSLANELKTYVKDTDTIQEVTTQLLNDFKDKPFKDTAKDAEILLINTLRDKAKELGFKELDVNKPSFKVAFGKFQAKLKKGDIQDLSEHIAINSLRRNRLRIQEELNIKPLAEFGTNYAEHYHSGESAIAKLLQEKQGQVSGAFYRKELGDIDLVWGDSKKGLQHIIERRMQDFIEKGFELAEAKQKALEFAKSLPDIIENGNIDKGAKRVFLDTENERAVIALDYNGSDGKWILTAYMKDDKAPISAYPHQNKLTDSTSSPIVKSALTNDIIPQQTLESTMQKFNYDEKKAKDLLEWHKDSSPLTKDENGVPKAENMLESKVKMQGQSVDIAIPKEKDFFKNLRNNTKKVLSVLKGQVFENINSGMKAQVSSDGINKMISVKAVDKSINNGYTKEEHFASVENVINLYKISKLTQSEKPNNNSVDVIAYHKFIADFSINHKPTKAKITLRETIQAGNRIYSLELLELEKASN